MSIRSCPEIFIIHGYIEHAAPALQWTTKERYKVVVHIGNKALQLRPSISYYGISTSALNIPLNTPDKA